MLVPATMLRKLGIKVSARVPLPTDIATVTNSDNLLVICTHSAKNYVAFVLG